LAIAALDPGIDSMSDPLDARAYQVLYRYAVARESMTAIGAELGISSRHAYRELQHATEALARILVEMMGNDGDTRSASFASRGTNDIRHELERLESSVTCSVELRDLLGEIVDDLQPFASERGIEIRSSLDPSRLHVSAKRVMLRQAVLNLISHALSVAHGTSVFVSVARATGHALLKLGYRVHGDPAPSSSRDSPYGVATTLLELMGIRWARSEAHGCETWITLEIPLIAERSVLIIDDNPGLIQLFRRFLHNHPYRVDGAINSADAKRLLEHERPDVIILDVMMPDRDGWAFLRTLRQADAAHTYRIIVCSIVNDPGLAAALGADAFLHKPVDRASLLQSLDAVFPPSE
jgi:CheY-like chemotaxis protein